MIKLLLVDGEKGITDSLKDFFKNRGFSVYTANSGEEAIEAVKKNKFHVYAVKNIDEGIEILTGKKAGELKPDGKYPQNTINFLVNEKLRNLAEGLKNFGEDENKEEKKERKTAKKDDA